MIAYLDAGTTSMVATAVVGGLAGIVVLLRMYWHRFLGLFSKKHRAEATSLAEQLTGDQESEASKA